MKIKNKLKLLAFGLAVAFMPALLAMENKEIIVKQDEAQKELNKKFTSTISEALDYPQELNTLLKEAQKYLDLGADIDVLLRTPFDYTTSLSSATIDNNLKIVKFLVQRGANIDLLSSEFTALMFAGIYNKSEVFYYLIEQGADIYVKDSDNATVLDMITPAHHRICNIRLQEAKTFYEMPEDKAWVIGTDSHKYSPEVKELGFNIMFNKLEFFNLMDIHHYDSILQKLSKEAFKKGICLLHLKNQPQLIKCIENNWHIDALDDIKEIVKNDPNARFSLKIVGALGKTATQNGFGEHANQEHFSDIVIN